MRERLFGARTGFFMDDEGNGGGGDGAQDEEKETLFETLRRRAREASERLENIRRASRLNRGYGRKNPPSRIKDPTGVKNASGKGAAQEQAKKRASGL